MYKVSCHKLKEKKRNITKVYINVIQKNEIS